MLETGPGGLLSPERGDPTLACFELLGGCRKAQVQSAKHHNMYVYHTNMITYQVQLWYFMFVIQHYDSTCHTYLVFTLHGIW